MDRFARTKLPVQISLGQSESVLDVSKNLPLKFGQIMSVTAEILLILTFFGGGVKSFL